MTILALGFSWTTFLISALPLPYNFPAPPTPNNGAS
eukprot:CAMPEP_0178983000 /NCGR_PEP_ID=MMETSP0795-20121207/805_1 /TAXON_ID=88552 /ORGANISM="Amoebophrya sp., Strain Ameob2" /LENGTH=35 /DNA_ID= /DNA_START= /DNA_END= /DNA_ORIENTATION=